MWSDSSHCCLRRRELVMRVDSLGFVRICYHLEAAEVCFVVM